MTTYPDEQGREGRTHHLAIPSLLLLESDHPEELRGAACLRGQGTQGTEPQNSCIPCPKQTFPPIPIVQAERKLEALNFPLDPTLLGR